MKLKFKKQRPKILKRDMKRVFGPFFYLERYKYWSMHEKYKESNLISYRIGNIMIYTYNIAFIVNWGKGIAS